MQQKLELLIDEESQVGGDTYYSNINEIIKDDDVEIAFLREKQARSVS